MTTGANQIDVAAAGAASVLLTKAYRWTWLFAGAGAALIVAQPGLMMSGAAVVGLSIAIAALCMAGARDPEITAKARSVVRALSPVLAALLLWLSMTAGALFAAGAGGVMIGVATIALFVVLLVMEGLVAAAVGVFLASIADTDPAIGVSLQIADKYAGFLGELI